MRKIDLQKIFKQRVRNKLTRNISFFKSKQSDSIKRYKTKLYDTLGMEETILFNKYNMLYNLHVLEIINIDAYIAFIEGYNIGKNLKLTNKFNTD